jgi:DNA-binding response OmpR family regulator
MLLAENNGASRRRIALPVWPQPIRVLVVDDFQARRRSLHHKLTTSGIATVQSANAINALLILRAGFFDVVYVCNDNFDTEAFKQLTHTASNSKCSQSPIVVLVREPTAQKLISARRQGADGYICPPFDATRLLEKYAYLKDAKAGGTH